MAQDTSPPTRDELRVPQPRAEQRQGVTLTIDGQMERRACALDNPDYADLTVTLNAVTFTGAERASDAVLSTAYEGYLGRELPIRALCDIRDRAAAVLADAGYLAAVEIPAQSLGDGVAEMRVVLGRLVAVRARGDTQGAEGVLSAYLERLVDQPVFNVNQAERYLLLANDVPGMEVRLSLRPAEGGEPGDLVGEVAVLRETFALDANVQNWGSKALGRFAGLVRAEAYGLTGAGDRTSISFFTTLDIEEQQTLQLAHDMRIGGDGLVLGGSLTLGWTEPNALPGFDIESETVLVNLEAAYPFLRTQEASVWGAVGFDYVDQDVSFSGVDFTRDRVRTAYLRGDALFIDGDSIARRGGYSPYEPQSMVAASIELRQGIGAFGATDDCRSNLNACVAGGAIPPARIEQDPTPTFVRGEVSIEYRPAPVLAISFDLEAQHSGNPLPAFEEFSGGQYSIGRGYDPGSIIGDSGVGASLEIGYGSLVPTSLQDIATQPFVFVDFARVWNEDPSLALNRTDWLASTGVGLRFMRGANVQGEFAVAVPLRTLDTQTERNDVRFLFSLTARLLPWRN
ncbi:BamA/TamA family outer membrane protein [Aurantiacibacter sp. MUD11]|uniref:ShlB/FhaC/HecB family hemolysin secretion/activation protein n=1 Tax=Aurantiacibacter sp. MUD11 TaxID=3003265 RepID=UPI0022AB45D8|nr:ShlB/FhaC/HecB family hemolysin secretion/activation protein [Aurantiacibacter sp. MUD11]WAT16838.1 BamA/TamA family outer membrane protein [Aurantiacibacter sp. MUD11]